MFSWPGQIKKYKKNIVGHGKITAFKYFSLSESSCDVTNQKFPENKILIETMGLGIFAKS